MAGKSGQFALGITAVALAALAVVVYVYRAAGPPAPSETFTIDGVCLACKQDVRASYNAAEPQPALCPKCGQRAVYSWSYCMFCKIRFVPALTPSSDGSPPRLPMVPACPKCGKAGIGYLAIDPVHQQAAKAALPKWPA